MVELPQRDAKVRARLRSEIFRGLRLFRRKRTGDVAQVLGMPQRSYEHFESGKGRLNNDRVHALAAALEADPYGIFSAIAINSPEFAIRTADNKLSTIFLIALQEFDATTGNAIANLDAYALMDAFTEMFDKLSEAAKAPDRMIKRWRREDDEDPQT